MLAQLDKVKGVEKSYVNRSGKLFRITISHTKDVESVTIELRKVLSTRTRSPTRVNDPELNQTLQTEEWRDSDRVTELSAIEHRTLTIRSVSSFAEKERLDKEQTSRLVKAVEEEWDQLAMQISTELRKDRDKRKWRPIYERFGAAMRKRASSFLSNDQLSRLIEAVQSKL